MILQYKTIETAVQAMIVEKKSKFICDLIPVTSEEEAQERLQEIKKRNYDAKHHCSAFIVVVDGQVIERSSDDREPSGTAGKPMLEVLRGAETKNILAVVTRYFGGVLLGTGGLIKAYTEATQAALLQMTCIEKKHCLLVVVTIDYQYSQKIDNYLHKMEITVYQTKYTERVILTLLLIEEEIPKVQENIMNLTNGSSEFTQGNSAYYYIKNGSVSIEIIQ